MIPTVTRTTEEMLATVPLAVREAALGLGVPEVANGFIGKLCGLASPGILTGAVCLLCSAVAGETRASCCSLRSESVLELQTGRTDCGLALQIFAYLSPAMNGTGWPGRGRWS